MRHIPHLYVPGPWGTGSIDLTEQKHHHVRRVLRRRSGSPISYTDGRGTVGHGYLADGTIDRGEEKQVSPPEPAVTMLVAPVSEKARARFIVEKLGELGVDRLYWLASRHSEARPPAHAKAHTWAEGALEQSRGAWLMTVVEGTVEMSDFDAARLIVAERGNRMPPRVVDGDIIVIGPPGGIESGEIPGEARRMGLGRRVLRVETAAVAAAVLTLDRSGRLEPDL